MQPNQELEELAIEEERIEFWTQKLQDEYKQLAKDSEFTYLTYEDIRTLPVLTENENEAVVIVNAPSGATMEVPDPKGFAQGEEHKYQIHLHSETGKILIHMLYNDYSSPESL